MTTANMSSMLFLVAMTLLAHPVLGVNMKAQSSLALDSEAEKQRPVTKVVNLLADMLKQMEKEQEEDEAVYEAMVCWCTTNDKEKTKAIADGEARIENLTTKIEELTALSAQLNTEISNLSAEVKANTEALAEATEMRQKELAEFMQEEEDMIGAIGQLKGAVAAMAKTNGASLIQEKSSTVKTIASKVQGLMMMHAGMLNEKMSHSDRKMVTAFIQDPMEYLESEPGNFMQYAPAGGQIFGVLKQMQETFQANLAQTQKDETTAQSEYEDLKATKEKEIATGQNMVEQKTQELATTDEKNAQAGEDLEDTKKTLAADQEFLANLKEHCAMVDAEWEERSKMRQMEMEAVSKAKAVLTSDEARDMFSKTLGFVQTASTSVSKRRTEASKLIANVAKKHRNPRLSALAYRARLDSFAKVKQAIDEMVADLTETQKAESKQKDFCTDEFNENQLQTEDKDRTKQDLEATIADLAEQIKSLTDAINTLKAEIAMLQVNLKRAGEDREKQNKEFQGTVADQRATQKLLGKALEVLEGFYGKKAMMMQLSVASEQPAGPPPPAGFKPLKKNAAAGGVTGMLKQIISDAEAMEKEALKSEEDAVKAYEDFVKETNASIDAKSQDIVNKSESKAKAEEKKVEREKELESTVATLAELADYKANLHKDCDFLLKNFEIRQSARMDEIEALKQAKAILSGAFLQK
eukprot:gnl/TRDRNA2_/TRDRNA2_177444_c4_seq2.p1 gnl/TRDRNA2_/TRDRNA2_177444_c4~~gnl/TRDRNA2_/TRDRNA2_177444_c4_seq2.p1  ORF type:complete len:696 (+),score=274.17 gnl/TRDRNA2_/TRDRNA2_177444_c4_seq2:60-2147(+)